MSARVLLLCAALICLPLAAIPLAAEDATAPLAKPEVPDPFGLGDRLALVDYLQNQLHATVAPGATYDDLVRQYWDIVDKPKREAAAAQAEQVQVLRQRLVHDFGITTEEGDPAKLQAMIDDAAAKATVHGADPEPVAAEAPAHAATATGAAPGAVAKAPGAVARPPEGQAGPVPIPSVAPNDGKYHWKGEYDPPGTVTVVASGWGTSIDIVVPDDWRLVTPVPQPQTAHQSMKLANVRNDTALTLNFDDIGDIPVDQRGWRPSTDFDIDGWIRGQGVLLKDDAVEGEVTIQHVPQNAYGLAYAPFTAKNFVPGPGHYHVSAIGALKVEKTHCCFTLSGTAVYDKGFQDALTFVGGMHPALNLPPAHP